MPTVYEKLTLYGKAQIDYDDIIARYPWIVRRNLNCILSPDSDGLLCGLLMTHFLDWRVRGFYDGKILVIEDGLPAKECQHMLLYNKNNVPENWGNFGNCFAPNNVRGYDASHDFRLKYPFGTIHLLIPVLNKIQRLEIPTTAITPLLFTDGTWMNLLQYTENSLDWIHFLQADDSGNPLHGIFLNDHYSLHSLMVAMDEFLRKRDKISVPRERGDRIAITVRGGEGLPHNLERDGKTFYFKEDAKKRGEEFIRLLADLTGWEYDSAKWSWGKWMLYRFTKGDFASSRLNGQTFASLMARNPLSFAITSIQNLEYTIEEPDLLPL